MRSQCQNPQSSNNNGGGGESGSVYNGPPVGFGHFMGYPGGGPHPQHFLHHHHFNQRISTAAELALSLGSSGSSIPNGQTPIQHQRQWDILPGDSLSSTSGGGQSQQILINGGGQRKSSKKPRRRVASVAQRRAANIRERRRMFSLNEGFDKLRRKVPTFAYEKRLSRIETLRLAVTYIAFMGDLLASPQHQNHHHPQGQNPEGKKSQKSQEQQEEQISTYNGRNGSHSHYQENEHLNHNHHHSANFDRIDNPFAARISGPYLGVGIVHPTYHQFYPAAKPE